MNFLSAPKNDNFGGCWGSVLLAVVHELAPWLNALEMKMSILLGVVQVGGCWAPCC